MSARADSQLYVVEVDDRCQPQLVGHTGCSYTPPPQPERQALQLVRALPNCTQATLSPSDASWAAPIAGGRRIIRLHAASPDGQLTIGPA